MISKGQVQLSDVDKVFKKMTSSGGIFFNGMNIASQTMSGKMSTLSDNVKLAGAALGSIFLPYIKSGIDRMGALTGKMMIWLTLNKEMIQGKMQQFMQKTKEITNGLKLSFMEAAPEIHWLTGEFFDLVKQIKEFISGIFVGIKTNATFGKALRTLLPFITELLYNIKLLFIALKPLAPVIGFVIKALAFLAFGGLLVVIKILSWVIGVLAKTIGFFTSLGRNINILWVQLNAFINKYKTWALIISTLLMPFVTIPLLIIKNWDLVKSKISGVMEKIKGVGQFFGIGKKDSNSLQTPKATSNDVNVNVSNNLDIRKDKGINIHKWFSSANKGPQMQGAK